MLRCWECKLAIVRVEDPKQFNGKGPSSNQDTPERVVWKTDKMIIVLDDQLWRHVVEECKGQLILSESPLTSLFSVNIL